MKKIYILLFLAFSFLNSFSQIVQNANMQTWVSPSVLELFAIPYGNGGTNSYSEPDKWTSLNVLSRNLESFLPGYQQSGISVFKETSGFSGFGARIKTIKVIDPTISQGISAVFGTDTIGIMLTGKLDLAAAASGDFLNVLKMGVPFTGRAKKINFKTKYKPNGPDTANVWVLLTKYNSSTFLRDTIGFGTFKTGVLSTLTWQSDSVMIDFNPRICANPDTITIVCSSSGLIYPKIGSEFFIDEFTTTLTTLSCDSRLSTLTVSLGTLNPAFDAATLDYGVGLPAGETVTPTTSYTTSFAGAIVSYTSAPNITSANINDRTTHVTVTAEDPIYVSSYTVEFHTISSNATLSDLFTIMGTFTPVFASSTHTYTVYVSYSTTFTPNVYPTTTDQYATYTITNASNISSSNVADRTTTIVVTAEDGVTTITYYVIFEKAVASTNANLFFLSSSTGSLSPAFSASVLSYTVTLTSTPGTNPNVFASTDDPNATRVINQMVNIASTNVADRTATVVVTAEDGTTTKTYQIIYYTNDHPITESINEYEKNIRFFVYPNPSSDFIQIKFDGTSVSRNMQLIDVNGKLVSEIKNEKNQTQFILDISKLKSGVYFIQTEKNTTRFIKE